MKGWRLSSKYEGSSRCRLTQPRLNRPPPSLHSHYSGFITTTRWSAISECIPILHFTKFAYSFSVYIILRLPKFSNLSPRQLLATSTPDPTQPVNRFLLSLSQECEKPLVLKSSNSFSTLNQWFACAQLSVSYLTGFIRPFPESFTTIWSPIQQHSAVCDPLLQADHGGPTTISSTASSCEVLGTLPHKSLNRVPAVSPAGRRLSRKQVSLRLLPS